MRTTKKERMENARNFYNAFRNGNCDKAAIVINRMESSNPNIVRCQFIAVPSAFAFASPVVIAESTIGIDGCFIELINSFYNGVQKTYHEEGFNDWLFETFGFGITYKDGLVVMLEKLN